MAAGMGSRYGDLKQIDRIGPSGETIIDYSVYDALQAGFGKVVFVIRKEFEHDFRNVIIQNIEDKIDVEMVHQELNDIPLDVHVSPQRIKPWGTGHAIWAARNKIHEPFAVINADDFYGRDSFIRAASFLNENSKSNILYCLVGYLLKNTLSDYGFVSRGECSVDRDGMLDRITERKEVFKVEGSINYKDDRGLHHRLADDTVVSMNMWGFGTSLFNHLEEYFREFVKQNSENIKAEFLIPEVINDLMKKGKIEVKVLESSALWFGITYQEDKEIVRNELKKLVEKGVYPAKLW